MNAPMTGESVSRELYEREVAARREAEALSEARKREVVELRRRLVVETEAVRSALAETETLRQREADIFTERAILAEALRALTGKTGADEALEALIEVLRHQFAVGACLFVRAEGDGIAIAACAGQASSGQPLPLPAKIIERARRLALPPSGDGWPACLGEPAEALLAPLVIEGEAPGALMLVSGRPDRFSAADLRLLEQIAGLAAQALKALREARRNALLIAMVEGRHLDAPESVLDAPLEAVHTAFSRLTKMQGDAVGILDALLGASLGDTDLAIRNALASMGERTGSDRVYVFLMQDDGKAIDNTHEWCAPGIEPMIHLLQGVPASMIDHWRVEFDAGREVQIADVLTLPDDAPEKQALMMQGIRSLLAVPMVSYGRFKGFVGFDAVGETRNFLPGEVYLIRSVAKVIGSVLGRRRAEQELSRVHAETLSQRARLQAVLSAMPDLIVELDREGRFIAWHSGAVMVPDPVYDYFINRTPEETLPPDLALVARAKLDELAAGARSVSHTFRLALLGPEERWWQMTGSAMGDEAFIFALRDITEIREQNAEIERLSNIARRTTNLVVVTDAARRIEWVNAAFERTTGWTLDEVRGQSPARFLHCEETDPETVLRFRAALDAGLPVQGEILNRSRTGEMYWLSIDIQPVHDASGALEGFMAVEVDITEQRRQADAQRRAADEAAIARAMLETAVEALQDGFVLYDADDRLVISNSRYREIYALSEPAITPGASLESILRHGLAHGQYPEAAGREEEWLAELLDRDRPPMREFEHRLPDGTWLRIYEKATPDGGRVGLCVDITALKLAEQRAIADRATAMEASRDGIAITDADGICIYMNRAHREMFGYTREEEVLGLHWSSFYAPDEVAWLTAHAEPALMRDGGWAGEIMGQGRDGRPVDQDLSLTLTEDGGVLAISRDMTSRRLERAERERLQNELQLAQRREMIGQMAAGLAHDFNNLLAVIAGGASLIRETVAEDDPAALGAGRILAASDQAAGLVRRLLALGTRQPARVMLDLRAPLAEATELLRSSLRAPMRLAVHLPERPVEALADPTDILQVVLNLAINARDALADHHGTITISLTAPEDLPALQPSDGTLIVGRLDGARRYACLSVQDTGPGMPPDVAARILDPYFSTKGEKGTGLGLAIVSSVIADNGGAMRLWTARGQGTRFDVYWPTEAPDSTCPTPSRDEDLTGRLDGRMVLVVDDQPEVLAIVSAYLEAAGAEVAPTTEPADILEALAADPQHWDLLVTDYDMPGMNGADLARAARAAAAGLPVILVTALAGEAGRSGADFSAVLSKPVDRVALVRQAELALLDAAGRRG